MANATVRAISTYPVKGLSPLDCTTVDVAVGQTLPLDRAYAIENGPGAFDPAEPRHLPKVAFLCLMRDAELARFHSAFDSTGGRHDLLISRNGIVIASGDLKTETGRAAIEAFFAVEMADSLRAPPKVVSAADHSFSDVKEKCVHIINLASVRALEAAMGRSIDPLRFRANLLIDGLAPWAELDGVGRTLAVGDARFEVFKRTVRCAATNVDPQSAERDADVPAAIEAVCGHRDFGVYAVVTARGTLKVGQPVSGFVG